MNKGFLFKVVGCFLSVCLVLLGRGTLALAVRGTMDRNMPIGEMVSRGEVSFESKGKRWARVESIHFPVFKGMKIKTGNGTTIITLSNNTQMEMAQGSELSLPEEDQIFISQGTVNFRIPVTAQTKFVIGELSVIRSPHLQASKSDAPIFKKMEDAIGTVSLRPNGSLRLKSERGSISIIDQHRNVLGSLPSPDSMTLPSSKVFGKGRVMVAQAGEALTPQQRMIQKQVETTLGVDPEEADLLEEYLIDFSKALKGKPLPPNLDVEKFFKVLEKYYPNQAVIDEVKGYSVKVENDEDSYDILICDKRHKWRLYRDLGKTTDYVEYPYWPERRQVQCDEELVPPLAVAIWEGEVTLFAILLAREKDEERKPICP